MKNFFKKKVNMTISWPRELINSIVISVMLSIGIYLTADVLAPAFIAIGKLLQDYTGVKAVVLIFLSIFCTDIIFRLGRFIVFSGEEPKKTKKK